MIQNFCETYKQSASFYLSAPHCVLLLLTRHSKQYDASQHEPDIMIVTMNMRDAERLEI